MILTRSLHALPAVALAALLSLPVPGFAQSILLSAGNFTLLGGTAITSTGTVGTTIRNGNVGLSPGATSGITGFPPAVIVNGAITATGPVTAQARLDLITASVGLAGMPSNANMSTVDLGGKTLAPGVYTFNGAASQSGALVLDAQGRNNVAWVFQIGTALTTSINSSVTFINLGSNGGSDLGVFWNAGSAINIGANNQLAGNYLAGTSIVLGGLSAGGGRALALAGISLDTTTIDAHGGLAGGDYTGGLFYSLSGAVEPSTAGGGTVTVAPGTLNGGLGTIVANVANSGTLSPGLATPGSQIGTLKVAGNYSQTPTGTLVIQLASPTSFDQLAVAGTAAVAGTLQVDTLNGFDPLGYSFPVVVATGGVSGTFAQLTGSTVATNRAAIGAALAYGPTTVTVGFFQRPFAGFAQTSNQRALAAVAQATPALTMALDAVPAAGQMPGALNALSPQGYQVWSNIAFAHATALADRLARNSRPEMDHDNYYFDVSQRRGRAQADADVGTATSTSTSELVGGDRMMNADFAAGLFFEHAKTITGLGSPGSHSTIKENMVGARSSWNGGPLFAHAVLGYGFDRYSSTRPIMFPGTNAMATSTAHGRQWLAGIFGGEHFTAGMLTVSPFVGLLASGWHVDGFTETGAGTFNATLAKQSARSLRSEAGVDVALNWKFGTVQFGPHLRGAWLHEFSDNTRMIDAAFGPVGYAVETRGSQRNSATFSTGVDLALTPRTLLYADYSVQTGGRTRILGEWRLGLVVSF